MYKFVFIILSNEFSVVSGQSKVVKVIKVNDNNVPTIKDFENGCYVIEGNTESSDKIDLTKKALFCAWNPNEQNLIALASQLCVHLYKI